MERRQVRKGDEKYWNGFGNVAVFIGWSGSPPGKMTPGCRHEGAEGVRNALWKKTGQSRGNSKCTDLGQSAGFGVQDPKGAKCVCGGVSRVCGG